MSIGKKIALGLSALVLVALAIVGVKAYHTASVAVGTKDNPANFMDTVRGVRQVTQDPREGFPGQDKVNILCMGIDDNWTNSDEVYTHNSRTDTLFLLSLDLVNKRASMLSIPRDSYAHIAGTHYSDKINSAFATGGPARSVATVAELTGVQADHYLVLNIDATKKMVDALGGVDVAVEHEMHYHDKWGHLSIDLLPGEHHLGGDQAVGFARYRHGDRGAKLSPEDGDERRMYRQHVLLRAMVAKAKTLGSISNSSSLFQTAMSTIRTDLTQTQMLDLAALYHDVQPDQDIRTATLPGEDFHGPHGAWDYKLYPAHIKAYVDWLVRDDPTALEHLTPIVVKNGTGVPGLAQTVVQQLKGQGFTDVSNGGNASPPTVLLTAARPQKSGLPRTQLLDTGVPDPQDTAAAIAQALGVSATVMRRPVKPNRAGWTPPAAVTISLGQDYAAAAKAALPPITNDGTTTN